MWHLFVSKTYLIIGHIARLYTLVLSKTANLTNVTPFGIKITFDYRSKKSKSCSILLARFEQKGDYRGKGGGAFVGMGSGALVAPLGSKTTVNYSPKKSKWFVLLLAYFAKSLRKIYLMHKSILFYWWKGFLWRLVFTKK